MTSFQRQLNRKAAKRTGKAIENTNTQPTRELGTHYAVLHPTRGWKVISYARARAQAAVAYIKDRYLSGRKEIAKRTDSASINRHTGKPHEHKREIARHLKRAQ